MKNATPVSRLPKFWSSIQSDAATLSRFEFIARYVAFHTKTAAGRALAGGMQLVETDDGWVYGFASTGPSDVPVRDVAKVYDIIRRLPLGYYTQQADAYRVEVWMARAAA